VRFLIEDPGDGWWHCPSPLRAEVIDGPAGRFGARDGARFPETYWLVRCDPAIEWNGDERFAERWGPDHALCRPISPTPYALVMASSPWNGPIDPSRGLGIPVYPVSGAPMSVEDALVIDGLALKVDLRPDPTATSA
jgi:hypothetical protein